MLGEAALRDLQKYHDAMSAVPYAAYVELVQQYGDESDRGRSMIEKIIAFIAALALLLAPAAETWEPDPAEVEMLACAIYNEAGGDACSDLCRYYVGDVILNRVADPRFPDTIEGVLTAPGQYGRFSKTGIVWPSRAKNPGEAHAVQRAYDTAYDLLSGNHSELYGQGYVWQAEFTQGSGFWLDGLYFGR